MKAKLLNFNNQFKKEGTSGTYNFILGIKNLGIELVDLDSDDYDYIIFSTGNPNAFGGVYNQHAVNVIKEIAETTKPVVFLFSDFLLLPSNINGFCKRFDLPYRWEDNKENYYMVHFCKDEEGFKSFVNSKKNTIKYKNYMYYNFGNLWNYGYTPSDEVEYATIDKPVYIGNHRSGERSKFLKNIKIPQGWDLYGSWGATRLREIEGATFNYKGLCSLKDVKRMMKSYNGHIITYDKLGLKYKADSTRLIETIDAGAIPLIDRRMMYIDLPHQLNSLFFDNDDELQKAIEFAKSNYQLITNQLKEWKEETLSNESWNNVLSFIGLNK